MATVAISSELEVLDKYLALVKESLGSESVYIRTKETLTDLFENSSLTSTERAGILSNVLGTLSNSLTNGAMDTAIKWASAEKDLAMRKLELERQLDILAEERLLKSAQTDKVRSDIEVNGASISKIAADVKATEYNSISTQASTIKLIGTPTVVSGKVVSVADDGKAYQDIQLVKESVLNAIKERELTNSKLDESKVAIHKVVSDTYTNYGAWSYNIDDNGISNVTPISGQSDAMYQVQKIIAQEQAKGYAYNAWANALTGASSMLGAAIAGGLSDFSEAGDPGTVAVNAVADIIKVMMPTDTNTRVDKPSF